MAIVLPAALEGLKPRADGYSIQGAPLIVSGVDAGPPKQRAADATDRQVVAATFRFKLADYQAYFEPFYRNTLKLGALAFDWVEPMSGRACEARFDGSAVPSVTFRANGRVDVQARLVVVF